MATLDGFSFEGLLVAHEFGEAALKLDPASLEFLKRKHLSLKDVAYVGGWRDTSTLLKCYQQPDPETIAEVVLGPRTLKLAQ